MRYLLDTCVLSDGARPTKFPELAEWLRAQETEDLAIAALSMGELRYGIQRLPAGRKRPLYGAFIGFLTGLPEAKSSRGHARKCLSLRGHSDQLEEFVD